MEEWSVSTVGEEFDVQLGKRLDAAVNRGELKQCINNRAVRWGQVQVSEFVLAPLTEADIRDLRVAPGDVLVCEGGEIGRSSVWNGEIPEAYFLNTLHRLRSQGRYEPRLLVGILEHMAKTGELLGLVGKSSLAHLTKENLLRVQIPVPPLAEQRRIVDCLLAADKLVATLERIIAKRREIKQGIAQELLTGKKRLFASQSNWSMITLGDATSRVGSGTTPRGGSAIYKNAGRPFVRSQNIGWGRLKLADLARIDEATHSRFLGSQIHVGDVLLNITGASIGRCAVADERIAGGNVNQHVCEIRLISKVLLPRFVEAFLISRMGQDQIQSFQAGGNREGLNFSQIRSIIIPRPGLQEQSVIAEILSNAEAEIATLQGRLAKTKEIQLGMMQQLLTGRTRLPIKETAA